MKNFIKDHRVRVTRMLLRKAFLELLSRKPIQSISVRELCEEAGINRSTFYAHYKDVYDLREQIETEMLSDFQEALAPLISQKKDRITPTDITAGIFRCLRENSDICAATLGKYGDRDFLTHLIDLGRDSCMKGYSAYFSLRLSAGNRIVLYLCKRRLHRAASGLDRSGDDRSGREDSGCGGGNYDEGHRIFREKVTL